MAKTVTIKNFAVPGAYVVKNASAALDNSYPNPAGYVFTPSDFNLNVIKRVSEPLPATLLAGKNSPVIIPTYDITGNITSFALHLIVNTTGSEVANATDVSGSTFLLSVEGF